MICVILIIRGLFMNRNYKVASVWLVLTLIVMSYVNCQGFQPMDLNEAASRSSSGQLSNQLDLSFASGTSDIDVNLSATKELTGTVYAQAGFSGKVNLEVDRSALDLYDLANDIAIRFEPSSVNLAANGSASFKMMVQTKPSAPSFDASSVKVIARVPSGDFVEEQVGIKVNAVVELKMFGGPNPDARWDQPKEMAFRKHASDLVLRFINYDTNAPHIVHGNASIPHQSVSQPLDVAPAQGQAGGVYEVLIKNTVTVDGTYYYHDIENNNFRRTMKFNQSTNQLKMLNTVRAVASEEKTKVYSEEEIETAKCNH